jgi:hypothetical protein
MTFEEHMLEEIYLLRCQIAALEKRLDSVEYNTRGVLVIED